MPARSSVSTPYPVTVQIPFGDDESVTVVFNRNGLTQNWAKRAQDGLDAEDVLSSARSLVEILLEWDIFEDDGTPTPITTEVLADLPIPFIRAMSDAIGAAGMPSSEEGNVSAIISTTPLSDSSLTQAIPPNGQEPSTTPASSVSPLPS